MIKGKRKTRQLYQRSRRQHYKTEYNRLNKQIKILIKQEHKKNWENKFNDLELKENQNNTWKQMKSMLGLKPVKTKYPTLITLDINNKKIKSTTTTQKIQTLTDTFKNIFTYDNTKPYFDNKHKTHIETELTNHVDKTSTLKEIPPNYKDSEYALTKKDILHTLYNISWHKGYHSNNWKIPLTILFTKPDKPPSNPSNYRPISLINNLSKILEKIIKIKLTKWAESNNKLNEEQAGFRAQKSTLDKIFQLTQTAMHAKNMKHFSAAIFMDVEKAFDKVWHDGLILTLINLGVPTIFVRYIKSFISQRHMYFQIQDLESPKIKLNFGVPQGSSLSPIHFLLYVTDIPTPTKPNTLLSQFADDIKIYSHSSSLAKIQSNLHESDYFLLWETPNKYQ